jgi:hypothetical protein
MFTYASSCSLAVAKVQTFFRLLQEEVPKYKSRNSKKYFLTEKERIRH